VDNPITLPNPGQNIQDSLRIYDSKPVLPDLWITMQEASCVASLAASCLRFLITRGSEGGQRHRPRL
jgi:hypothetical protein